jgi:hypothetical protein
VALPGSSAARELAIQLLTREGSGPPRSDAADAPDRVCAGVSDELSRWIGRDGCRALFARALATAQADGGHPVLDLVRVSTGSVSCLDGLAEGAARCGSDAATAGATAILSALIELLGHLIGEDMALSLLAQTAPSPRGARVSLRHSRGAL